MRPSACLLAASSRAGNGSRRSSPSGRPLARPRRLAMIEMQEEGARAGRRGRRRKCGCRGSARPSPPARPTRRWPRTGAGWCRRSAVVRPSKPASVSEVSGTRSISAVSSPASPAASASRLPLRPAPTTARSKFQWPWKRKWLPPGLAPAQFRVGDIFARMAILRRSSRRTAAGRDDQKENVLPRVKMARPSQLAVLGQSV